MSLNWTEDQVKEHMKKFNNPVASIPEIKQKTVKLNFQPPEDPMNKWERRYVDTILNPLKFSKQIFEWYFELLTFNLAPRTTYTPDFIIIHWNKIEVIEIKGKLEDDASVKYKTARSMFPFFEWKMLRWNKDNQEFIPVKI